jgi:hypothetical protein
MDAKYSLSSSLQIHFELMEAERRCAVVRVVVSPRVAATERFSASALMIISALPLSLFCFIRKLKVMLGSAYDKCLLGSEG